MARDYAKKGKKGGGRSATRSGAKPVPGWLWLVTGLAVGSFTTFLVYLSLHERSPAPPAPTAKERAKTSEKKSPPAPVAVEEKKAPEKKPMKYDFYTWLQEFEVEVPEDSKAGPPRPLATPGSYVLQAGSFKSAKDADTRKAELALLGIRSTIQTVAADRNTTYHRVRIGPYRDLDLVNKVRKTLRENGVDFVTLQERS